MIINNIIKSFTTEKGGFSSRKLSAFAGVMTAIYVTTLLLPKSEQINALYAWLLFALACLGLIRIEQIIELKNGKSNDTKS